jgi:predicted protein tyrosine phosphatase
MHRDLGQGCGARHRRWGEITTSSTSAASIRDHRLISAKTEWGDIIATMGDDVAVCIKDRTWLVQRHYIALHGLKGRDLPNLKFPELLAGDMMYLSYRYAAGGHILNLAVHDYRDQIFSHRDDDGTTRHFHIIALKATIQAGNAVLAELPVDAQQVAFTTANRSLDETHIKERISDEYLNEPGIICLFADDSHLIVDGNHRYVKRARLGLPTMLFWMLSELQWRQSLLIVPSSFNME